MTALILQPFCSFSFQRGCCCQTDATAVFVGMLSPSFIGEPVVFLLRELLWGTAGHDPTACAFGSSGVVCKAQTRCSEAEAAVRLRSVRSFVERSGDLRHVLSDAVVGGSHVVNRSEQRYFHYALLLLSVALLRALRRCSLNGENAW